MYREGGGGVMGVSDVKSQMSDVKSQMSNVKSQMSI